MSVTLPTLSNQFPNVIVRTAHSLTAFVDTVKVEEYSWAYVKDGEWVVLDTSASTETYKVPGAGAVPAAANLANETLYLVLGKTTEPPRQVLSGDVQDPTASASGRLPVYKGHDPVEIDSMMYDPSPGTSWTVGCAVYIISALDASGNARTVLSPHATGDGATSGKLVGECIKTPAQNAAGSAIGGRHAFVRVMLNNL